MTDPPVRPSCSVIIKYLKDKKDIVLGHNTWLDYASMSYRILKNYNLNYHLLPNSSTVIPGHTNSMSSYAGVLGSLDDFLLTSAGLAAIETTMMINKKELFNNFSIEVIFEPVRAMVASRLSENGSQWARIFEKFNWYVFFLKFSD